MRLLVDECVDERLRLLFTGHECETARFASLAGLTNGRLLKAAEDAGFDVLITVDQNILEAEPQSKEDFGTNPLWTDQPIVRFGVSGTRSDLAA